MHEREIEKVLRTAWFARRASRASERELEICRVIEESLAFLDEADRFLGDGSIYRRVIYAVYFASERKTLKQTESEIPLHPKSILRYRRKYLRYMLEKLTKNNLI